MFTKPYVYAETAFHHEGDQEFMIELIKSTADSNVEGIKFQILIDSDSFVSSLHKSYNHIKSWCFDEKKWEDFLAITIEKKLDIIWMPLDIKAVLLAKKFKNNIKYIEIHSVSFYDEDLHIAVKETGLPVLLGIGGRTFEEIDWAIRFYGNQLKVLMMGFQSFPSLIEDIRLKKILTYKKSFTNLEIGYADHTSYADAMALKSNEYAYLLGASIFEKHITTQEGIKRTDFESAISSHKLSTIHQALNQLYKIMNSYPELKEHEMTIAEIKYRDRQKVCVAKQSIIKGAIITAEDVVLKMVDTANGIAEKKLVVGKKINETVHKDEVIKSDFLN